MKKIILVFLVIVLFFLYGCTDKDTMQPDADYTTEVTYDYEIKKFNEDKIGLPLIRIRDLKTAKPSFYIKHNTSLLKNKITPHT